MAIEKLQVAGQEVSLNSEFLKFNETTLTQYIITESGYYDNFGASLALAEKNLQNKELIHERFFAERYMEAKDSGGTEKYCESRAKVDADVVAAKEAIIDAKYIVQRLKQHLKAWDKNHDNAQSLGHMIRKSMDKLNADIPGTTHHVTYTDKDIESSCPAVDVAEVENERAGFASDDLGIDDLIG